MSVRAGSKSTADAEAGDECPPGLPGRRRNIFALALVGLLISAFIGYFVFSRIPTPAAGQIDRGSAVRELQR